MVLNSEFDIFPNSFILKKAYKLDNFINQLPLRLLRDNIMLLYNMRSFTFWTIFELLFKHFWGSVLPVCSKVSRALLMVAVAPCPVTIFSMLLESTVKGLIMCCFYANDT